MITIDEASRCVKCHNPGVQTVSRSGTKGSKLYTYECRTAGCPWFSTGFIVQVKADGSVYEREVGPKEFEPIPDFQKQRIDASLEALRGAKEL